MKDLTTSMVSRQNILNNNYAIDEIKNKAGVKVISLNMVGSVRDHADLVVTDPVQAGVMAVMSIAKTAKFDIDRVDEVL